MYEIGALRALEEAVEGLDLTQLDVYVGISAGALVTATLANGIPIDEQARAIDGRSREKELNIKPGFVYTPALTEYGQRLRNLPRVLLRTARDTVQRLTQGNPAAPWAAAGALLPNGFFDNAPLERHLARLYGVEGRTNDFRELAATLRVVAVNLDTAAITTFGDEATAHVPISKAVQASTALPGLYGPVEIEGQYYIDGVARRTVHASMALEADVDLLFCLNPIVPVINHVEQGLPSLVEQGLPTVLSQTFRLLVYSRMLTGFRQYAQTYPDADVVLIEPHPEDSERIFTNLFSFSNRQHVCEHAYETTRAFLRAEADTIAPLLARHGLRLRTEVLDDPDQHLFRPRRPAGTRPYQRTEKTLHRLDRVLDRLEARLTDS